MSRQSQAARRASATRRRPARRGAGWRFRITVAACSLAAILFAWAILARALAPTQNTAQTRFDAIIVLGYKVDPDGNPTPLLLSRVTEGVHEYERGVAPRLIVTGGSDRLNHVQAEIMARVAESQGVPASAIFLEPQAGDTIQNACYSARIMKAHGWTSAEIVSSPSHLPRAGTIFNRLPIQWRAHPAPPLEAPSTFRAASSSALEVLKTLRYLVYANWAETCSP